MIEPEEPPPLAEPTEAPAAHHRQDVRARGHLRHLQLRDEQLGRQRHFRPLRDGAAAAPAGRQRIQASREGLCDRLHLDQPPGAVRRLPHRRGQARSLRDAALQGQSAATALLRTSVRMSRNPTSTLHGWHKPRAARSWTYASGFPHRPATGSPHSTRSYGAHVPTACSTVPDICSTDGIMPMPRPSKPSCLSCNKGICRSRSGVDVRQQSTRGGHACGHQHLDR